MDVWDRAGAGLFQVADNVGVAARAGGEALPDNAFGLMCTPFLLPAYSVVETVAETMMVSAQAALERVGRDLRAVGQGFGDVDEQVGASFDQLAGRL